MPHADSGLFSRLRASLYGIIFILYRRINLLQRLAHKLVSDQLTGSREFGEHHLHSVRRRLLFGLSTRNHLVAELLTSPEFATTHQNTTPVTTALNTLITNDPPHNPTITNHSILTTLFNRLASFDNSLNSSDLDRSLRVLVAAQSTRGELTGPVSERERRILSTVADGDWRLEREIFDEILGGSTIQRFGGADFYYPDTNSAWVLTNEIWVGEDYFFESSREDPLVIDAGVHAGMAILYVKSLYPKARVIGFEPNCLISRKKTFRHSDWKTWSCSHTPYRTEKDLSHSMLPRKTQWRQACKRDLDRTSHTRRRLLRLEG